MNRRILHIDMDAFFASIEQKDSPELKGRPVVVGSDSLRGVIAAASYEARSFGVRSAMPSSTAKKLCPGLIFTRHRMQRYKEESQLIFDIFHTYSPLIEALSIDEAFLDVTETAADMDAAAVIAMKIKKEVRDKTGLSCSAGISVNKFLAKLASDINKPDGMFIIYPSDIDKFICDLPIEGFFGIGKVTAEKMHRFGIHTGADLRSANLPFLVRNFGKAGRFFYDIARGIDNRMVEPDRIRKSIGAELTFEKDLTTGFEIIAELYKLEKELWSRVEKHGRTGRTVSVKVKYDDFRQVSRSNTLDHPVDSFAVLHAETQKLREQIDFKRMKVRLLGVSITGMEDEQPGGSQLRIWK